MANYLERAANALFPASGNLVGNVKFFRGLSRRVTADQMAEQLLRADAQVRSGESLPCENIDGDLTC